MKIRNRWVVWPCVALCVMLLKMLYFTCRKRIFMHQEETCPYLTTGDDRYLYCIWHDQILMTAFTGSVENMCGLTSLHSDGTMLSYMFKLLKLTPVRGSSSRGGAKAMREMMDQVKDRHMTITPDGPRGPRREAKMGLVFLAKKSGRQVVPVGFVCKRGWHIQGNWTDMMLPFPFTKIYVVIGKPISVPADCSKADLKIYLEFLQSQMQEMEHQAHAVREGTDFSEFSPAEPPVISSEESTEETVAA